MVAATQKRIAVFSIARSREKSDLFLKSDIRLNRPDDENKNKPAFIKAP